MKLYLIIFIFLSILNLLNVKINVNSKPLKNDTEILLKNVEPVDLLPLLTSTLEYTFKLIGNLTNEQKNELFGILNNENYTKMEIKQNLKKWNQKQNQEIQRNFEQYMNASQKLKNLIMKEIQYRAQNLSDEAHRIFYIFNNILNNNTLTPDQECKKLDKTSLKIERTHPNIAKELRKHFGALPRCSNGNIRFVLFPEFQQKLSRVTSNQSDVSTFANLSN